MENWTIGKNGYCIVTDTPEGLPEYGGFKEPESIEYYGGALVCESIMRKKDLALISAAPDMLDVLKQIVHSDYLSEYISDKITAVIKKATILK